MITAKASAPLTRRRPIASVGLVVAGVVMLVVVAAWLLFPSLSIPSSRLMGWQLHGFNGTGFDPTTAQTTDIIRVAVAVWPSEYAPEDSSWLAPPAVTYTPWSVIITLHTSDSYAALIARQAFGLYDTGGWVDVPLSEPLGGRTLFDGATFPPTARPYR